MYVSVQGIPFHSRLLSVAFNTVSWLALAHFSPKVFLLSFGFIFGCYSFNRKQNVIAQLFLVLLADCFFFLGCVVFFFLSSHLLLFSCCVCNSQSVFLLLIFIKWKITELGGNENEGICGDEISEERSLHRCSLPIKFIFSVFVVVVVVSLYCGIISIA